MRLGWIGLGTLFAGACDGGKVDGLETGVETDADADTDTDTDSDADTDTDTDTEVAEPGLDQRPANPTCVAPARPLPVGAAKVTPWFSGLSFTAPMLMLQPPGDDTVWWLIEQSGLVWRFDDDPAVTTKSQVLDWTGPVVSGGEMGLLGFAFHPDYATNGYVYLHYSRDTGPEDHQSVISRFETLDGGLTLGTATEKEILVVNQPASNHNGGMIGFGPDGYLYIGLGDGGGANDTYDNGQDRDSLLAKILRLDVDGGDPYAIPADNPFAAGDGAPEAYAMGLRNPYRWSFDPVSGELWLGDVGQDAWEEVDKIALGGNYGWPIREGFVCLGGGQLCSAAYEPPVAVYAQPPGGASVTGGVVYRGAALSGLEGVYLYTDYYAGDLTALFFDPTTGDPEPAVIVNNSGLTPTQFAYADDGEVYILDHAFGAANSGGVFKLEPNGAPVEDPFPDLLSETGCFDPLNPLVPVEALIPYDVNQPFWSDGADKARHLAIPDGTTITVEADGDWDLPVGSVVTKHFTKEGVNLETRLLVRHDDGDWAGYSYRWRDDLSDAELVAGTELVDLPTDDWSIPGDSCARCHTEVAGGSLGLQTRQLNGPVTYPSTGRTANQIATLDHIGLFTASPGDAALLEAFPLVDDPSATAEEVARVYLDVNCAMCHQPDGPTRSDLDFDYDTALADMNACGAPVYGGFGIPGALIVTPGDPAASVLALRVGRRDADQMPPLGTSLTDPAGIAAIDEWILGLAACP